MEDDCLSRRLEDLRLSLIEISLDGINANKDDVSTIITELSKLLKQVDLNKWQYKPMLLELYSECLYIVWRMQCTDWQIIPKIILISLPKSGTKQVENFLKGLNYRRMHVPYAFKSSHGRNSDLWESSFKDSKVLIGRNFMTGHISASEFNTSLINRYGSIMLLLIRNPIQTLVSWCYYIQSLYKREGSAVAFSSFRQFGILYAGDKQIDFTELEIREFMIQRAYPRIVEFLEDWMLQIKDIKESQYLLLSQEQMRNNPDGFYKNILVKIRHSQKTHDSVIAAVKESKLTNHNFRKGSVDEWKDFFDQDELKQLLPRLDQLIDQYPGLKRLFYIN